MKTLIAMLLMSQSVFAFDYKFHYGDQVIVHSSAWKKPCYSDEFYDVCGKVGTVVKVDEEQLWYYVKFTFKNADPLTQRYHQVHLKKVK